MADRGSRRRGRLRGIEAAPRLYLKPAQRNLKVASTLNETGARLATQAAALAGSVAQ